MISVRATIKGEPDVPAFTKFFEYGSADEEIFFSSSAMVEERLRCGMRLNANEALALFCSHVVKSIRNGKQESKHGLRKSRVRSVIQEPVAGLRSQF